MASSRKEHVKEKANARRRSNYAAMDPVAKKALSAKRKLAKRKHIPNITKDAIRKGKYSAMDSVAQESYCPKQPHGSENDESVRKRAKYSSMEPNTKQKYLRKKQVDMASRRKEAAINNGKKTRIRATTYLKRINSISTQPWPIPISPARRRSNYAAMDPVAKKALSAKRKLAKRKHIPNITKDAIRKGKYSAMDSVAQESYCPKQPHGSENDESVRKRAKYSSMEPNTKQKYLRKKQVDMASRRKEAAINNGKKTRIRATTYLKRINSISTQPWPIPISPNCPHCHVVRFYRESPGFCCSNGQISLHEPQVPGRLWDLYTNESCLIAKHFRNRCRTYNNSSAFTSLGITYDKKLASGEQGVYTLKVNGGIYHFMRDLEPTDGVARQLQLYFYGTETEFENRLSQSGDLMPEIIRYLMELMKCNPYATFFKSLKERASLDEYKIVLRADPCLDQRVYNEPVVDHIAAIWNELDDIPSDMPHDIRVETTSDEFKIIHYYYSCYDPLQYPLLFPFAEPGWHAGIRRLLPASMRNHSSDAEFCARQTAVDPEDYDGPDELICDEQDNLDSNRRRRINIAAREYYCYMFQIRPNHRNVLLRAGRLGQQFQIDMYVKIETRRLDYLRHSQRQDEARMESFQGIADSMAAEGVVNGQEIGQRMILPPSFIGGPRDMRRRYLNALTLVSAYGKPCIFLTITCNPNWPEIQAGLFPGEEAQNRSDLVARVFRAKNEELKDEIINKHIFGKVAAHVYVIEFQKRGLPHAHWLIILEDKFKITSPDAYDTFVSAEIPDESNEHLYNCVMQHMMHGPCGVLKPENVCMVNHKCKNHYPKDYVDVTTTNENSYPIYRRRNNGRTVLVRGHELSNSWVVPYNPYLLAKFDCHINVEIVADIKLVKYLYKYVCKGNDRVAYNVIKESDGNPVDEISDYQSARWLSSPEAMWRILGFNTNEMHPSVLQLNVHLPNQHRVWFTNRKTAKEVLDDPKSGRTTLTEFFHMNANNSEAISLNLLYRDFPKHFVWNQSRKEWTFRKQGTCLGRLVSASPVDGERYYLRILLNHVNGPTSFSSLRTYNGIKYSSFREAALNRGLLESDNDVRNCLDEASAFQMPYTLRRLFATILIYNSPGDPRALWEEFKIFMSDDFVNDGHSEEDSFIKALQSVDIFLQGMGKNIDSFSLVDFQVATSELHHSNQEFQNEANKLVNEADLLSIQRLNPIQERAFVDIIDAVANNLGKSFFIDGPGGTGKTFLYRALLAKVRSQGNIALAVASSGVAASLLPGGRTAHSRFKLPIMIDESMTCSISKQSAEACLIVSASLIIWDEASMANRKSIESLNDLLQDLTGDNRLFGGKTVVFGGDFRQTIPIVVPGTREDAVAACFVRSPLWRHIHKIRLVDNMRARDDPAFTEFLLRVGDGREPYLAGDNIRLPSNICLPYNIGDNPLDHLIMDIFPKLHQYSNDPLKLINRAILTARNDCVDEINEILLDRFPGKVVEYYSTDLTNDPLQQSQYQDFLNSVNAPGLPSHKLRLKDNSPIMLLRNINPSEGLCNGTRLICLKLGKNIIQAQIAVGDYKGKLVFIPRIPLEASDRIKCPIPFKRHQYPIRLCFAMTINKAQGQTLDRVGIYLREPVFSHGQLYVALSRVRTSKAVKVLIRPPTIDMDDVDSTRNVVYREVLTNSSQDVAH